MALTEGDKAISAIHRKTALVDHINLIPIFNGDPGVISYGEFRRSFDRLAALYGWEEEEKIFVLFTRVSGAAAQLLRTYEKEAKTFSQLTDILSKRYDRKDSPAVALQKFMTFRQTAGMSVQEFYDKAKHLSLSALIVDGGDQQVVDQTRKEMLKSMLINNLSPEIKKGVVAKDPKDPEEILKLALLEEKSWEAVRADTFSNALLTLPSSSTGEQASNHFVCAATYAPRNQGKEIDDLKEQVKLLTAQVANLVAVNGQQNDSRRENLCFKCNLPGHYARSCGNFNNQRGNWGTYRNFNQNRGDYQQQRGNSQGFREDNRWGRQRDNYRRGNGNGFRNDRGQRHGSTDKRNQEDTRQDVKDRNSHTDIKNDDEPLNE